MMPKMTEISPAFRASGPPGKGGSALLRPQMRFPAGLGSGPRGLSPQGAGCGAGPRRGPALGRSAGSLLGVPAGAHSGGRAMEALAELLAALPALATALALLLAWLLLRRRPAASSDPDRAAPEPAPPTAVRATSAPPGPAATEDAAAPQEPGEPAEPAEEQAAEEKQVRPGPRAPLPLRPVPFPAPLPLRPRGARNRAPGLGRAAPEDRARGRQERRSPSELTSSREVSPRDEPVGVALLSGRFPLLAPPAPLPARSRSASAPLPGRTPTPSRPRFPNPRASGLFQGARARPREGRERKGWCLPLRPVHSGGRMVMSRRRGWD